MSIARLKLKDHPALANMTRDWDGVSYISSFTRNHEHPNSTTIDIRTNGMDLHRFLSESVETTVQDFGFKIL